MVRPESGYSYLWSSTTATATMRAESERVPVLMWRDSELTECVLLAYDMTACSRIMKRHYTRSDVLTLKAVPPARELRCPTQSQSMHASLLLWLLFDS